jgi:predicted nucleic acid-binding protein
LKAVSNAGPLIHLSWIDHLDLLRHLFAEVVVPAQVADEVLRADDAVAGVTALRGVFATGLITVVEVSDLAALRERSRLLDIGEAAALELMRQLRADIVLLDDRRARIEAERLGMPMTGTVGLLKQARERGVIPSVIPILTELRRLGFWCSDALLERMQREERGDDQG